MTNPPLVLGINGSPYKNGLTAKLLRRSLKAAQLKGISTHLTHLADHNLQLYDGRRNAKEPRYIKKIFNMLRAADGIIFATSVWYYKATDHLNVLYSHLCILECQDYALEGKVAGFLTVCEEDGAAPTIQNGMMTLCGMGCFIPPYCNVFHNKKLTGSEDNWQNTDIELLGDNIARAVLIPDKPSWDYKD